MRRLKTMLQASFRPKSPERVQPSAAAVPVTLGKVSAITQGGLTRFHAGGQEIAVASVGSAYYALNDICTHLRCSLSEGELDGTTLECICHGSQFNVVTGDVVRGPAQRPVQVYAVRVQGDDLVADIPAANSEGPR